MNYDPKPLSAQLASLQWKLALYHSYEQRRAAWQAQNFSEEPPPQNPEEATPQPQVRRGRQLKFPSWLANMLKAGEVRFRRLEYLMSVGAFDKKAYTIVREPDGEFLRRHPDFMNYLQWPGPRLSDGLGHAGSSTGSSEGDSDTDDADSSDSEQASVQEDAGGEVRDT